MISLPAIAAAGSVGSSLFSMFGGGNQPSSVPLPQSYQLSNMGGADQGVYSGTAGLGQYNNYASVMPQAGQTTQNLYNNSYDQGAQGGANVASGLGMAGAVNQFQQGQSLYPYAQQVIQTGFDPQNALYNRTAQQLQDQVRTGESARGISMSPYGAGLENQAMSNFNIDWQNNQLQRQTQAGQAGSSMINAGSQIAGQAPGQFYTASQYPYSTFQGQGQNQMNALQGYGAFGAAASALPQQQIQDYLAYIGAGNQSTGAANQTAQLGLNQQQQGFNQNQILGGQLGAGLQGLSRYSQSQYPGAQSTPGYYGGSPSNNSNLMAY